MLNVVRMSYLITDLMFAGSTDVGVQRSVNQDSYYVSPQGDLFIVADGMGGHVGGKEASRLSTDVIREFIAARQDSDCASDELLKKAVFAANEAVLADQRQHPDRAEMGTTVVIVMVRNGQFWCAHVGDSRLYLLRESGFMQLTQDHTWVAQAMVAGELSAEQLATHPWRHVLSQCVGREDLKTVDTQMLKTEPGDRLLLCSDGLSEELSSDAIITYLQSAQTCEEAVSTLISAANVRGGRDNITAIALAIPEFPTVVPGCA
ncbi:MAG: protein phosphatase 2C domain-containing protein [Cyanobacteria bacterium J06629_19]